MRKIAFILLSLGMALSIAFPAYAKDTAKFRVELKSAYAFWEFESNQEPYGLAVTYTISHVHEEAGLVDKNAIVYVVISWIVNGKNFSTTFSKDLVADEYNLPTFSQGKKPSLTTTIQVSDPLSGETLDLWIDLEWECTSDKAKFSLHPPQDDPNSRIISFNSTYCAALASGAILAGSDRDRWMSTVEPSEKGIISHQTRIWIEKEQ